MEGAQGITSVMEYRGGSGLVSHVLMVTFCGKWMFLRGSNGGDVQVDGLGILAPVMHFSWL